MKRVSQVTVIALLKAIQEANKEPPGFGLGYFGRYLFVSEETARRYVHHCSEKGLLVLTPRPGHVYQMVITEAGEKLIG